MLGSVPDGLRVTLRQMVRRMPGGLPNGSLAVLRRMVRILMGPAYCRRLARIASPDHSVERGPAARPCVAFGESFGRDGPGVLPDGSLAALRRMVRIETGPAYCPTARSYRSGSADIASVKGLD